MVIPLTGAEADRAVHPARHVDDREMRGEVAKVLDRWPSAGLAVGVVQDGRLDTFHGHGVADVRSGKPVTPESVFRIGSVTKTFTAVAVMQLAEQRLVDLDAPANDYLRAFQLVPAKASFQPSSVRDLLTHTAGIGYWRRFTDLLAPGVGSGVRAARSGAPPLAQYYRRGLPVEVEPGTKWVYSNHGFAALGQIVEDVTGQPLARYLHEHLFAPLGMEHTDLARSERVEPDLATGYVLRSRGLRPVTHREVPAAGAGGAYSTTADLARYAAALLNPQTRMRGVLRTDTVATMFRPHFQADPRLPGMGLGFLLGDEGGHHTVGHDGIVSGFLSQLSLAPDDGVGVVVLANTGALDGRGAPEPLGVVLLRRLLGLPDTAIRTDVPPHPEEWGRICGWYGLDPGPVTNLFTRALIGAGAQVSVRGGHLVLTGLTPLPAMRRGLRLHPDDPQDPLVFRVDFSEFGKGTLPVAFTREPDGHPPRLLLDGMAFRKRSDSGNPRYWVTVGVGAGTASLVLRRRGHRRRHQGLVSESPASHR